MYGYDGGSQKLYIEEDFVVCNELASHHCSYQDLCNIIMICVCCVNLFILQPVHIIYPHIAGVC